MNLVLVMFLLYFGFLLCQIAVIPVVADLYTVGNPFICHNVFIQRQQRQTANILEQQSNLVL